MEHDFAQKAPPIRRGHVPGLSRAVNADAWASRSAAANPAVARPNTDWVSVRPRLLVSDGAAAAQPINVAEPTSGGQFWWEAAVPVAARSLDPSSHYAPASFSITELRGIPAAGLNHFVLATSTSGKQLYGAYVQSARGEWCLQQLFEFSRTAVNAGVFLPVPTVGGHFLGTYGLDYALHRFWGSIDSLPRFLRWAPVSQPQRAVPAARPNNLYRLAPIPVQVGLDPLATVIPVAASAYHNFEGTFLAPPPAPPQRGQPNNSPASNVRVPPSDNANASSSRAGASHSQYFLPPQVPNNSPASNVRVPPSSNAYASSSRAGASHSQYFLPPQVPNNSPASSVRVPPTGNAYASSSRAGASHSQYFLPPQVPNNSPASSHTSNSASVGGASPLMTLAEAVQPLEEEAPEPTVQAVASSSQFVAPKTVPPRCHPCFLCEACRKHWGTSGLPERYFKNARKAVFRTPEEDIPPVLSREKTAARKRKWLQARHGPRSKTSQYRGVNLYKRTLKWESHIWYESEQLYLGASLTKVHAAQVYDKAALFLFGHDAQINFQPEIYQAEFEFLHRLTHGQMVVYLRRESRQNGEEVAYPGVYQEKPNVFRASYRPEKDKASHEHIGYFRTEDDAARAVMKEAKSRKNYEMAGKIMDVHHVRTIKPAPGKTKQSSHDRAACVVAAMKVTGLKPLNFPITQTRRGRRSTPAAQPAQPNPAMQTQAADQVAIARPKRKYVWKKNAAKSKAASPAAEDTVAVSLSREAPPRQETEKGRLKRKYTGRSPAGTQRPGTRQGTPGPLPQERPVYPALVNEAKEQLLGQWPQGTGAARTKRKYTRKIPRTQEMSAPRSSTPVAHPNEPIVFTLVPQAVASPEPSQGLRTGAIRKRNLATIQDQPASEAPNAFWSTSITRRRTSIPTRSPEVAPPPVAEALAPAAQTPGVYSAVPNPRASPAAQTQGLLASNADDVPAPLAVQAPVAFFRMSGSEDSEDSSDSSVPTTDTEDYSTGPAATEFSTAGSSSRTYHFVGPDAALTTTPPQQAVLSEPRLLQFLEACSWMNRQGRRYNALNGETHPWLRPLSTASNSSDSPRVIRPVARRLVLVDVTQADAVRGAQQVSVELSLGRGNFEGGGGEPCADLQGSRRGPSGSN